MASRYVFEHINRDRSAATQRMVAARRSVAAHGTALPDFSIKRNRSAAAQSVVAAGTAFGNSGPANLIAAQLHGLRPVLAPQLRIQAQTLAIMKPTRFHTQPLLGHVVEISAAIIASTDHTRIWSSLIVETTFAPGSARAVPVSEC